MRAPPGPSAVGGRACPARWYTSAMLEPVVPPLPLRLADQLYRWLGARGGPKIRLSPDDILRRARRSAGLHDLGEQSDPAGVAMLHEGLARLCTALHEEAELTLGGALFVRQRLVDVLGTRLRLVAWERDPPPERVVLTPPIVILGLPRSGTTWLHRLMVEGPDARALALWEFGRPVAPRRIDRWITVAALAGMRLATRRMDAKHHFHPDQPEEDMLLLDGSGVSLTYAVLAAVPSYLRWMLQQDPRVPYGYWARLLRVVQARCPGKRLVLKAPAHTPWVDAILHAVPDACVVQTHRDPVPVLGSFGSLLHSIQGLFTDRRDPVALGRYALDLLEAFLARSLQARRALPADRVVDVPYAGLIADPTGTVARLHDRLGLPYDAPATDRVARRVAGRPQRAFGPHPYSLDDLGLAAAHVRARLADYERLRATLAPL